MNDRYRIIQKGIKRREQKGGLKKETITISKKLKDISYEDAKKDYDNLVKLKCSLIKPLTRIGNKYLDYFFFPYRLETKNKKGLDYLESKKEILKKKPKSFYSLMKYSKTKKNLHDFEKIIYDYIQLYYGSVSQFPSATAKWIYCKFKPKTVLDFSAGWGGRMLGAMVLPDVKYIGFDTNTELKTPYNKVINDLGIKDRAKIIFRDSSKVDFSKYDYDLIFTSPPYFKIEVYKGMPQYDSNEDFIESFYKPVILNSYKHLKKGGHMVLNIPINIYDIVKKFFRGSDKKIPLGITKRDDPNNPEYNEFMYVWKK